MKKEKNYVDVKVKGTNRIKRYPTMKFYMECIKDIREKIKCF